MPQAIPFITAAWTATSGAMAVAGFVLKTAVYAGVSHLANKVFGPKTGESGAGRQADVLNLTLGEGPREMIVGRAVTGGSLVQAFSHGGPNGTDKNTFVIAIADERCDGLEGVFIDDLFVAHTADGDVSGTSGGLNIRWRNGAPGQTFPVDLRSINAAQFDADDRLAGVAHVWVTYTAKWVQERGGRPRFRFRVRGGRRYNPAKDSEVPGGSGTHRWNDPSTWEWTENLILNRYAFQRGVFSEGRVAEPDQLLIGRGLSAIEAPPERIIAWINLCDEAVALKAGGSEPRWRVGGVIRSDESYQSIDAKFAAACGGVIIQPEGGVEVEPGHAKAAVKALTDSDLLRGRPVAFSEFLPEGERVNTVVVRYVDPGQNWQMHSAPVRRSIADITADGGPNILPIDLDLVTSGTQAQRVGEIARRKARLEKRASLPLGARFSMLERGDWATWTSPRWMRGETKTFRVVADPLAEDWTLALGLEEINATVFAWTAATDEITPMSAPPDLWADGGPVSLSGVAFAGITRGGVPGIRATYATPVDPAVEGVRLEVRLSGQTEVAPTSTRDLDGSIETTSGVAPGTAVQVRLVPLVQPHRSAAAVGWTTLTPGQLVAGTAGTAGTVAIDTTRPNTDDPPSYYRAQGPGLYPERKTRAAVGIAGSGTVYGVLRTDVPSTNTDEAINQSMVVAGVTWKRRSVSESAWEADWVRQFSPTVPPSWTTEIAGRPVELTDGRVAAGFDSFGDLARNILTARANSSSLLRRTAGGLFTGELDATLTSAHSAAGVIGGGALLWLNAAPWGTHVSGRPTELTDGRISAGLDAVGDLNRNLQVSRLNTSNVMRRTAGGLFTGELTADETATHASSGVIGGGALLWLNSVGSGQIDAGAVGAPQIGLNAVTISRIGFTMGPNLFPDPDFQDWGKPNTEWLTAAQGADWIYTGNQTWLAALASRYGLASSGSGKGAADERIYGPKHKVTPGKNLRVSVPYVISSSGYTGYFLVYVSWRDASDVELVSGGLVLVAAGPDYRTSGSPPVFGAGTKLTLSRDDVLVPAAAVYARIYIRNIWSGTRTNGGTLYIGAPQSSERTATADIDPQAVNTNRIANNATGERVTAKTDGNMSLATTAGSYTTAQSANLVIPATGSGDASPAVVIRTEFSIDFKNSGVSAGGHYQFYVRIYRDGVFLISVPACKTTYDGVAGETQIWDYRSIGHIDNPPAGATYAYDFRVMWTYVGTGTPGVPPTRTIANRLLDLDLRKGK